MAHKRPLLRLKIERRLLTWLLLTIFVATGCQTESRKNDFMVITGFSMGTSYSIKIVRQSGMPGSDVLHEQINRLLSDIDSRMSTYLTGSEISKFNSNRDKGWQPVSPQTFEVLREAVRISQLSSGAFDITIGGLVELWGFGRREQKKIIPDEKELAQLLSKVGFDNIKIREVPPAIRKMNPEITIDLSAIAKGYAVDQVADFLDRKGIFNFLVEIGGEIKTRGLKNRDQAWRVAIERPISNERTIYKIVSLKNKAMATSGDYRNFFELDSRRYSHTLDPKTGRPIEHGLASVTVVHESCMTADALATALMVSGVQKGYKLAEEHHLAAMFISRDDSGFNEKMTSEFRILF